uniref:Uncharacterized protein n=1 Tax=Fagus sylvatica TaxID=28930 RepID=A0A2N9FXS4_FAGSY
MGLENPPKIEADDENRSAIEAAPNRDSTRTGVCSCSCSRSPRTDVLVLVPPSLSPTCSCTKNRCCS